MSYGRIFASYALSIGAFEFPPGGRKLRSGRISPYFFNSGLFNTGGTLARLADTYARVLDIANTQNELRTEVIFGPAYKGIPLAVAVATCLARYDNSYQELGYAFNRKEEKDHGEGGLVVGHPLNGLRVMILDDVMSAGESFVKAVEIVRMEGGIPIGGIIAFDRQERVDGGTDGLSATQSFTKDQGLPVYAAATLDDLIYVLQEGQTFDPTRAKLLLPKILEYKDRYGIR